MSTSDNRSSNAKSQKPNRSDKKKDKNDDWTKTATCKNCGKVGHISPQYKAPKSKEANRYISGALYAILEAEAQAFKEAGQERSVIIFIDNGCSLNGVSENLVKKLEFEVNEGEIMQVDLGHDQVMPVPENKDVILGMVWLREQNPDIDWEKAERFKSQEWEALKDNSAFSTLRKYANTVFCTKLSNETPPVTEVIEHEILLKPGANSFI
ncbi:unnamed protein product [Peronospora destructor]|uniref:CCHC-type domain-containing protein n=1 Tax=Peronospora destructor TaxID=86335 RepID=A0AAV0TZ80_9STRA|nr:unnamed protein product [Peronospora destructor]